MLQHRTLQRYFKIKFAYALFSSSALNKKITCNVLQLGIYKMCFINTQIKYNTCNFHTNFLTGTDYSEVLPVRETRGK